MQTQAQSHRMLLSQGPSSSRSPCGVRRPENPHSVLSFQAEGTSCDPRQTSSSPGAPRTVGPGRKCLRGSLAVTGLDPLLTFVRGSWACVFWPESSQLHILVHGSQDARPLQDAPGRLCGPRCLSGVLCGQGCSLWSRVYLRPCCSSLGLMEAPAARATWVRLLSCCCH